MSGLVVERELLQRSVGGRLFFQQLESAVARGDARRKAMLAARPPERPEREDESGKRDHDDRDQLRITHDRAPPAPDGSVAASPRRRAAVRPAPHAGGGSTASPPALRGRGPRAGPRTGSPTRAG